MPMNVHNDLAGDIVAKSAIGRSFDKFRVILKKQGLEDFFRSSYFGFYLDLSEETGARFQMAMVYGLLKCMIICEENDEVWINLCGMPVCFDIKEFVIVTGLRCHPCEVPIVTLAKPMRTIKAAKEVKATKKAKGRKGKNDVDLVDLVRKSYKEEKLIKDLQSKNVSKKHKESMCLVWFVHSVLWAKDTNINIPLGLIKLAEDYEAFNNYGWGRESFRLTIYLEI
ncbi:uncharacterized protein LOC132619948 [Lycium barbarum]|uniref:uncharacterized protein LOC132619948 n=1 Tax=Lycium barbarum TaxID=112863 RepID=UPI00293E7E85|nr:uncharacterized protein LOC132619948 [Lycium barbarum]